MCAGNKVHGDKRSAELQDAATLETQSRANRVDDVDNENEFWY